MDNETRELFLRLFDILEKFEISMKSQFAELRAEIAEIKAEIAGIKVEIAGMKVEIAGMKVEIAGLKDEQARTNERLDAVASLYGHHEVAIQRLKQKMIL